MDNRLYRSRDDRMLAGVAGGLGDYFGIDSSLIRIGFVLLFLAGGFGLLLYIVMAIVVPEEDDLQAATWSAAQPPAPGSTPDSQAAAPATDWRSERQAARAARRAARAERRGDGRTVSLVVGGFLILLGVGFLLREFFPVISFDYVWPLLLVFLGVVVILAAFRGRES